MASRPRDFSNDPIVSFAIDSGEFGEKGETISEDGLFVATASGRQILMQDVLAGLGERQRSRRVREPTIPWAEVDGLLMGRIGLHGLPDDLLGGPTAREQMVRWIGDALEKLGYEAGRTSIQDHATLLMRAITEGQRHWPLGRK